MSGTEGDPRSPYREGAPPGARVPLSIAPSAGVSPLVVVVVGLAILTVAGLAGKRAFDAYAEGRIDASYAACRKRQDELSETAAKHFKISLTQRQESVTTDCAALLKRCKQGGYLSVACQQTLDENPP